MARSLSTSISAFALTAAMGLASFGAHGEDSLTVVSWGGAYGAAQKTHMIDPFQKDTGVKVLFEDYSGGVAEMKAQVESGNIQWDVVDVEVIDLERACSEGLLETIPHDILPAGVDGTPAEKDFIPDALSNECAIGNIVWSVVFAYNEKTIGDTKATSIGDFFDTAKIPGKRAMRKRPQVNMEWALLADGVAPKDVYEVLATPEGQERAFKKLDTIKKDIVWFDSWSQAPQLLNDGGAVLVQSANGRFYDSIRKEGKPFVIVWDGHVYDLDAWAVLKGSPKKDLAFKFIAYATQSKPLAGMSDVAYGPTRKSSTPMMDPAAAPHLPTAHLDQGIRAGSEFWADYGESLGEKFNEWLLK
ncbi:ABC transporter substrate-binding protein [Pseudomonas sp. NPDC078700]|uniref:ABC transporter substrate-binding protein n=1 Tax=Pseudomonas sp. NPDC078700 TaxID=3364424 RepID=UPI0037CAAA33